MYILILSNISYTYVAQDFDKGNWNLENFDEQNFFKLSDPYNNNYIHTLTRGNFEL